MRVFLAVQIPSETCIEMIEDHCKGDINMLDGPSSDIKQYEPMIKLFKKIKLFKNVDRMGAERCIRVGVAVMFVNICSL